jgi:hypothetical protein
MNKYRYIAKTLLDRFGNRVDDHYEIGNAHIWFDFDDSLYISSDKGTGNITYKKFVKEIIKGLKGKKNVVT